MGRVALQKTVVLPKMLYYFSNLPLWIPTRFFMELESRIREFIWNKSQLRVELTKMYSPVEKGGLAVPDMEQYYLASQLQWATRWLYGLVIGCGNVDSILAVYTDIAPVPARVLRHQTRF
ncbi:hypothetical protein NDU88_003201 [Pleurodeles waltl]|uniref:Uncharacterized protein n=1 Tax=Pleurodeles waltl TaxID=8319 RepID=A0AAV7P8Y4_PLEWA|nr:hypothetical protein NDU88_003201 [Pleurodeles waltl]